MLAQMGGRGAERVCCVRLRGAASTRVVHRPDVWRGQNVEVGRGVGRAMLAGGGRSRWVDSKRCAADSRGADPIRPGRRSIHGRACAGRVTAVGAEVVGTWMEWR